MLFTSSKYSILVFMISISKSQIDYVIALNKTGSFSEAADLCHVTQSTLSTMIKKLENQFDYILFDRKSKPIRLTKEGELLISQFKNIHHQYEKLEELVQETKDEIHGNLSIGIIPTLAPFLLPLFLDRLVSNYQKINFYIYEITTSEIITRLKSKELDIGILSIPITDKDLDQKTLFTEEFLLYDASGKYKPNKTFKIEDIDLSRLWLLEESHCLTHQINQICHLKKKRSISNNLVYNSGSIISLLELVNINKGLTLLPKLAIRNKKLIDNKLLFQLKNPTPAREIGIVTHPDFVKKRILNVVEQEIKKSVKPILSKQKKLFIVNPN